MGSLLRLLPYLRRYSLPFWGGIAGLLVARIFEALIPLLLKQGIDSVAAGSAALAFPALGISACVVGRFVAIVSSRRVIRRLGMVVAYDLRQRIYAHLQRQGSRFFARHPTGDLMARAINDVQIVRQVVGQGTRTILVLFFSAVVGLAFMLRESLTLTLLLLPPLPFISVAAYLLARRIYAASTRVQEGFSTLSERVQENLNGIRTIHAQGQEDAEVERFRAVNTEYADRYLDLVRMNSMISSVMPALGAICTLVIIGMGGSRVLSGELSVGSFVAFFWYVGLVLWPVREAGNMVNLLQRGAAATTRIYELLDSEPEIEDRGAGGREEVVLDGRIDVDDLVYTYEGSDTPAIDGISLSIQPGETVAFIGRVGSGKSTLLRLLVRLLDPPPGSVRLDGRDLRDLPLPVVRGQVAMVPQDPFLFAEALHGNVSYDDPERPESAVWRATEHADLSQTVEEFPEKLETIVGERGVTLSGGQKQRATLARGLIRKAPVLLLDDCFSSVDTETEERILRGLRSERKGRTTLVVSHRVSTARRCDRIYVLREGRIAEQGSHEELVARGGLYAELERAQSRRGRLMGELEATGGGA